MKYFVSAALASTLAVSLSACAPITPRQDLVGTPVPAGAAGHTVHITSGTRYVNVIGGDVVRFESAGQAFAWDFNASALVSVFPLNGVAPGGMLDHEVLVYLMPDPLYNEGSELYARSRLAGPRQLVR